MLHFLTAAPITPEQAIDLAQRMLAACDGNTWCTFGQVATLANLADHLPTATAEALNLFLAAGAAS